jgi:hypothetical protein
MNPSALLEDAKTNRPNAFASSANLRTRPGREVAANSPGIENRPRPAIRQQRKYGSLAPAIPSSFASSPFHFFTIHSPLFTVHGSSPL